MFRVILPTQEAACETASGNQGGAFTPGAAEVTAEGDATPDLVEEEFPTSALQLISFESGSTRRFRAGSTSMVRKKNLLSK